MSEITFSGAGRSHHGGVRRAYCVIGDSLGVQLRSVEQATTAMKFNVQLQPAGSDIFSGLGTAGSDVSWTEVQGATVSHHGLYRFHVTDGDTGSGYFTMWVWPAEVLDAPLLKYSRHISQLAGNGVPVGKPPSETFITAEITRTEPQRRALLAQVGGMATDAELAAALTAPAAPHYGVQTCPAATNHIFDWANS